MKWRLACSRCRSRVVIEVVVHELPMRTSPRHVIPMHRLHFRNCSRPSAASCCLCAVAATIRATAKAMMSRSTMISLVTATFANTLLWHKQLPPISSRYSIRGLEEGLELEERADFAGGADAVAKLPTGAAWPCHKLRPPGPCIF